MFNPYFSPDIETSYRRADLEFKQFSFLMDALEIVNSLGPSYAIINKLIILQVMIFYIQKYESENPNQKLLTSPNEDSLKQYLMSMSRDLSTHPNITENSVNVIAMGALQLIHDRTVLSPDWELLASDPNSHICLNECLKRDRDEPLPTTRTGEEDLIIDPGVEEEDSDGADIINLESGTMQRI